MTLLGLDLNATCARAVLGPVAEYPLGIALEPPGQDLPMVLNLENYAPEVGRSGLSLVRNRPHLTCGNFLPHLGLNGSGMKRWHAGRHRLDSSQALALVWKRLEFACTKAEGVILTLPSYLTRAQAELAASLGNRKHVSLLGSIPSLLAAALVGFAEQAWIRSVLVIDIDDHALSMGLVQATDSFAHLVEMRHFPELGWKRWQDRLINALADCCILQTRRDPRDVPQAEQGLFDQLDELVDACSLGRMMPLGVQGSQWYQNLLVEPEQTRGFCARLTQQAVRAVESFIRMIAPEEIPASILLTAQAGRLPGLAAKLRSHMAENHHESGVAVANQRPLMEDFGDGLLQEGCDSMAGVAILNPDATARAAHGLGTFFLRKEIPPGHQEVVAPLPQPQALDAGPARLRFQGQDFVLQDPCFIVGAQAGCQLLFDQKRYPTVAGQHCEIRSERRKCKLRNRCQEGTQVNDEPLTGVVTLHAGDWIRLGADGPLVRFLGQRS